METLHLSTDLSGRVTPSVFQTGIQAPLSPCSEDEREEQNIHFGVTNVPLFSLGVALLEFGHWKPLTSLKAEDDVNDVVAARRIAKYGKGLITPAYIELVNRCLRCNFGVTDENLSSLSLSAAVHRDIISPLMSMIQV